MTSPVLGQATRDVEFARTPCWQRVRDVGERGILDRAVRLSLGEAPQPEILEAEDDPTQQADGDLTVTVSCALVMETTGTE